MDAILVEKILKSNVDTKHLFRGVFARDELPLKFKKPGCFIFNTENRGEVGEHWLAVYYHDNGLCEFFDSYGQSPLYFNLESYLQNTCVRYVWNRKRIQGVSTHCGYYCILFLLFKCSNKSLEFFNYFTNDYKKNDKKIDSLIKEFY